MIDIYRDDSNYKFDDLRNRSWRLSTKSVNDRLRKKEIEWKKAFEEERFADLVDIAEKYEYDIVYDDIRNGLILPENEIIELLEYFIKVKDMKKSNYLAWILNNYYKKSDFLVSKLNESVKKEEYEISAIYRDLLNIKKTPLEKE